MSEAHLSEEKATKVVDVCLTKGWIEIPSATTIREAENRCQLDRAIGPLGSLPIPGLYNMTRDGQDVFLETSTLQNYCGAAPHFLFELIAKPSALSGTLDSNRIPGQCLSRIEIPLCRVFHDEDPLPWAISTVLHERPLIHDKPWEHIPRPTPPDTAVVLGSLRSRSYSESDLLERTLWNLDALHEAATPSRARQAIDEAISLGWIDRLCTRSSVEVNTEIITLRPKPQEDHYDLTPSGRAKLAAYLAEHESCQMGIYSRLVGESRIDYAITFDELNRQTEVDEDSTFGEVIKGDFRVRRRWNSDVELAHYAVERFSVESYWQVKSNHEMLCGNNWFPGCGLT